MAVHYSTLIVISVYFTDANCWLNNMARMTLISRCIEGIRTCITRSSTQEKGCFSGTWGKGFCQCRTVKADSVLGKCNKGTCVNIV